GEHACSRLARADDRRMFARAFVRGGLANGHKVVYLCDRDRDQVIADLTGQGDEVQQDDVIEAALASDQLDIRGASDTYMPTGRSMSSTCSAPRGPSTTVRCRRAIPRSASPARWDGRWAVLPGPS
ncbi:MAG: MEDS domain-containing protein, partial [Solirubrobacteraceae bacterium]